MSFNPAMSFMQGQQAGQAMKDRRTEADEKRLRGLAAQLGEQSEEYKELMTKNPESAMQLKQMFSTDDGGLDALIDDSMSLLFHAESDPSGASAREMLQNRIQNIPKFGGRNSKQSETLLNILDTQGVDALKANLSNVHKVMTDVAGKGKPKAGTKEIFWDRMTRGLTQEQVQQATMIELGLSPRAVGSAIQTIAGSGTAEEIGKAEATIAQRKKFGELTGSSRAKAIDNGIERMSKIDLGLNNINRAIGVLEGGAGSGAIQKYLPSFKAASVALDHVQKSMALDVIGAVTFGALSEGELSLAKEVALPTGLDGPELIAHLKERRASQEKLRAYFNEQIQFLDQGGTVAGFMREKERSTGGEGGQSFNFDAQGNLIQ